MPINNEFLHADFEEKQELRHGYGLLNSRTCDTQLIFETHGDPYSILKKVIIFAILHNTLFFVTHIWGKTNLDVQNLLFPSCVANIAHAYYKSVLDIPINDLYVIYRISFGTLANK